MRELPFPELEWLDGGIPASTRFGDVYYSAGGKAEAAHVFMAGIGAPETWAERRRFTVAETGFGTGLNFLCLWDLWRRTAPPGARLDYVAVEGFPMAADQMARAQADFPAISRELLAKLPPRRAGYHALSLDGGRVGLTLLYGEAAAMLAGLEARVDAWFLDGFAPAKNPDMWTPALLRQVARLTRPDGRIATFTAAGAVRRGLEAAGFAMEKRPGFGAKRECLAGRLRAAAKDPEAAPWFRPPEPAQPGARVAVVGAGIAGATAARALTRQGFDVTIFEAGAAPAAGASGTPAAVLQPRPYVTQDANGWFHAAAYRRAIQLYDGIDGTWLRRGLLVAGRDADDAARFRKLADAEWLDPDAARERTGLDVGLSGAWFADAGTLDTQRLCQGLSDGIEMRAGVVIDDLARLQGEGFNAVVLAAGPQVRDFQAALGLELYANRGQVSRAGPTAATAGQIAPVTYGGYLTPAGSGGHVIGSSFRRIDDPAGADWRTPRADDDTDNLALLAARLPGPAAGLTADGAAWTGLRATTTDRMPFVGALPDRAAYAADYADLRHGAKDRSFPPAKYRDGLYTLSGLGSRGFLTAPLAADILAAMLAGAPLPQPRPVLDALHPARFAIRHLKRRSRKARMGET